MVPRSALFAFVLLAGCGSGEVGNRADKAVETAVQTATLTGLYEASGGASPSQLCVVDRGAGNARFGIVLRGSGESVCSGAGSAVLRGSAVILTMAGDEACTIEGQFAERRLTLPAQLPAGCSYYCSPGATMAGAGFVKVGGSVQDAMRARDLIGDPLCAGMGAP